jgi:hypothetical protein
MMATIETDPDRRTLYRAAGVSAVVLALVYVLITGLYVTAGTPPTGVEGRLTYLAANETAWWAIVWLSVITDLLYVPVALALYLVLAPANRTAMLAGAALLVLFVVLDLAITWPNYAGLITMSGQYADATGDAQRAALVATASYPTAILDSSLLAAYIILIPGLGVLIIGAVMIGSVFGRGAAYLGVATGVAAVVSVLGPFAYEPLETVAILAAVLTLAWFLVVGIRLLRFP